MYKENRCSKKTNFIENPNIGVIDLETYTDTVKQYSKAYACGLDSSLSKIPLTYYINNFTLDCQELVLNLITEMFKYKGFVWYCPNFGNFDAPFIIKALLYYNKSGDGLLNPFILDAVFKDNVILKLTIGKHINNGKIYITIVDSYRILPYSLEALGKTFNVWKKRVFPYKFVKENTL